MWTYTGHSYIYSSAIPRAVATCPPARTDLPLGFKTACICRREWHASPLLPMGKHKPLEVLRWSPHRSSPGNPAQSCLLGIRKNTLRFSTSPTKALSSTFKTDLSREAWASMMVNLASLPLVSVWSGRGSPWWRTQGGQGTQGGPLAQKGEGIITAPPALPAQMRYSQSPAAVSPATTLKTRAERNFRPSRGGDLAVRSDCSKACPSSSPPPTSLLQSVCPHRTAPAGWPGS